MHFVCYVVLSFFVKWIHDMPLGRRITALAVGVTALVVTGSFQLHAATSASEFEWQLQTGTPPDSYWYAITYGEELFVVVGADYDDPDGAEIVTSRDGVTWSPAAQLDGIHEFWSVSYGNGRFVATGLEYSNNWQTQTAIIATSQDGINWTKTSVPGAKKLQIAFGEGVFVAISDGQDTDSENQILTSTDGADWIRRADITGSQNWSKITYGGGKFVAVSTSYQVITSDDGTLWSLEATGPTFDATPQQNDNRAMSLVYGNGKFVLLSSGVNDANPNIGWGITHVSSDAKTWTSSEISEMSQGWLTLSYDGTNFVGIYGNLLLVSENGDLWTDSEITLGSRWMGLTFAHSLYVVVDDGGQIMTSGTFTPPAVTPPTEETPTNNEVTPSTTVATAPTTTVATKVKKQDTLPETGSSSSTPLLLGSLLLAGGLAISLRRRIMS
jgi:LPXTG-motif cell wall-anchored protein